MYRREYCCLGASWCAPTGDLAKSAIMPSQVVMMAMSPIVTMVRMDGDAGDDVADDADDTDDADGGNADYADDADDDADDVGGE